MRQTFGTLIRSRRSLACAVAVMALTLGASSRVAVGAAETLPALPERLSAADFWKLATDISEPGGYFRIEDNFTSNEREIGALFTEIRQRKISGDVYIGVGPEQNLSYIAAIRPKMAFIIDIRRQAVMQHLMFKAMFELAKDRSEFISLLFGRKPPRTFDAGTAIHAIWSEYLNVPHDSVLQAQNYTRVTDRLLKTHGFRFTADETEKFNHVFAAFNRYGPDISTRSGSSGRGGGFGGETFRSLTAASDMDGQTQSFLSTEENFQYVKALHEKNLIVPVSGDFGGPKALRAIGAYVKERGGVVRAYYVSNVEQYLFQDGKNKTFYDNVASLPVDSGSVFIRPYSMRRGGGSGTTQSLCPIAAFIRASVAGQVFSNNDALACVVG